MNNEELWHLYDNELRRQVEWTRMQREVLPGIVRYLSDDHRSGFVAWCDMNDENANQIIEEQMAYFCPMVDEFEWKWYSHDRPADLQDRLLKHDFKANDPEALMVMDLQNAPGYILKTDTSAVRRVTTPGEIDEIIAMESEIWSKEMTRLGEGLKHDLLMYPDLLSVFGIWQDGRVVSAAWQFYLPPTRWVSLFGGSTLEQYRSRGYYTALIAARAREAVQRGYRFLNVDASPDSRPILEKHGFQQIGQSIEFDWSK